jgi:hypothetical protein
MVEGQNLTGDDTDHGYDLHSRGPPTLDAKALDNILIFVFEGN